MDNSYYAFRILTVKYKQVYESYNVSETLRLFGTSGSGSSVLTEIVLHKGTDDQFTCNTSDATRFELVAPPAIFSSALFLTRHWKDKGIDLSLDSQGNVVFYSIESPNE